KTTPGSGNRATPERSGSELSVIFDGRAGVPGRHEARSSRSARIQLSYSDPPLPDCQISYARLAIISRVISRLPPADAGAALGNGLLRVSVRPAAAAPADVGGTFFPGAVWNAGLAAGSGLKGLAMMGLLKIGR